MAGTEASVTWNGDEVVAKLKRAQERALVGYGYSVSQKAKALVHVKSGTCRRSIHLAMDSYADSTGDFQTAGAGKPGGADIGAAQGNMTNLVTWAGSVGSLSVGSWLVYAHRLEVLYPYMAPALQMLQSMFATMLAQAMAEEGLAA